MTNNPYSAGRDVHADQSGIIASGDVHQQAGGDAAGRDLIKIETQVVQHLPTVDQAAAQHDEQHSRLTPQVRSEAQERLDQARKRVVRLELGFDAVPDAVTRPLDDHMRHMPRDRSIRPLPAHTTIWDVFIQEGGDRGGLLILGDPGAGKTTLLLELTLALTDEADRSRRVPVVVPLSTWRQHRRPLAEWLVDQLHELYYLPSETAARWVQKGQVLPLLDGLDEIDDLDARAACVTAINEFRRQYMSPIVVCSRCSEYEALWPVRLELAAAIVIRPLDPDAVRRHLQQAGDPLAGVRAMLKDDPDLLELCRSPLLLSLLTLTYHGQPPTQLRRGGSPEQRREQLFHDYVTRALANPDAHRGDQPKRPPEKQPEDSGQSDDHGEPTHGRHDDAKRQRTVHWLGVLAHNLSRHDQTVFLLERLQPDWLPVRRPKAVAFGFGLAPWLFFGLLLGLLFVLLELNYELRLGLVNGLIDGLRLGLISLLQGLTIGLFFGLINAIIKVKGTGRRGRLLLRVQPTERLTWSWTRLLSWWRNISKRERYIRLGSVVLAVVGMLSQLWATTDRDRRGWLSLLVIWLAIWLAAGLSKGFESGEIGQSIKPNEGILNSLRYGLTISVGTGLLFGLILGLIDGLIWGVGNALVWGPLFGLVLGAYFGLTFGLGAVLQHGFLRLLLWRYHVAPLGYVRWLEEMVRARLLYRVGGGYAFVHGLLRDYLEKHAGPGCDSDHLQPHDDRASFPR